MACFQEHRLELKDVYMVFEPPPCAESGSITILFIASLKHADICSGGDSVSLKTSY